MSALYELVMDLSIPGAWAILAVVLARLLLRRAPASFRSGLWAVAALALLCPFRLQSPVSLVPELSPAFQVLSPVPIPQEQPVMEEVVGNPVLSQPGAAPDFAFSFYHIWLLGLGVMALAAVLSYIRLSRRVRVSAAYRGNVRLCDGIPAPFILGIFRPIIYLPSDLSKEWIPHVLAHERAHLRRGDHILKLLAFCLLCVYWFHPLVWLAYVLFCRDMELACDQWVIRKLDRSQIRAYSETLIACSAPGHLALVTPLAFGEIGVLARVKSILSYKKPTLWVLLAAIVVTMVVGICFLTDPAQEESAEASAGETVTEPSHDPFEEPAADDGLYNRIQALPLEGISASVDFGEGFPGMAIGYGFFPEESQQLIALLKEVPENAWLPAGEGNQTMMTIHMGELTLQWDGSALWSEDWMVYSLDVNDFLNRIWKNSAGADVADWVPLGELPTHYNAEQAMIDGVIVLRDGIYLGEDKNALARFQSAVRDESFDTIRVMNQGEDTKIYEISKENGKFILHWVENGEDHSFAYDYLKEILVEEEGEFRNIWRYVLKNRDGSWESNSPWPWYYEDAFSVFCYQERYIPHPELPGMPLYADLTQERELIAKYEDPQMLEELLRLLQGAEGIGFEPKTYDLGPTLRLHYGEGAWVEIQLNMLGDLMVIDGIFYDYGPGYHADGSIDATERMLELLGLNSWPE